MQSSKRITMTLILISLTLLLCPVLNYSTLATADLIIYEPEYPGVYLLNPKLMLSKEFMDAAISATHNSIYNIISKFDSTWSNSTIFKHTDNDKTFGVNVEYKLDSVLLKSLAKGDLKINYAATITNDKHWNIQHGLDTYTAYTLTWIDEAVGQSFPALVTLDSSPNQYDCTLDYGDLKGDYAQLTGTAGRLGFRASAKPCTCGSTQLKNIGINLLDTTGPKVISLFASESPDSPLAPGNLSLKSGQDIYFHLKFNENIRFAADAAPETAPGLKFKLIRNIDDTEDDRINAEAKLYSLKKDTLVFKYTVPDQFNGGIAVDHYISTIKAYSEQTALFSGSEVFDLKHLGVTDNKALEVIANSSLKLNKSTSLITDMAGNPMIESGSLVVLKNKVTLDMVPPELKTIEIAGPAGEYTGYVGVNGKLGFTVTFSEELALVNEGLVKIPNKLASGNYNLLQPFNDITEPLFGIYAELNIGSSASTPLLAKAMYMYSKKDGNSNRDISVIYFNLVSPIPDGAIPITSGSTKPKIGITKIIQPLSPYTDNKWKLCDLNGNLLGETRDYFNGVSPVFPMQDYYLDVIKPTVTTSLTPSGGVYTPVTVAGTDGFYFPIKVEDTDDAYGDQSGINGVIGSWRWFDSGGGQYPFRYAVSGSAAAPADGAFTNAVTGDWISFTQVSSGNFIHIRPLEGVAYNIASSAILVNGKDAAGNTGYQSFTIAYQLDKTEPEFKLVKSGQSFSNASGKGEIKATVSATDQSEIRESTLAYQWVKVSGEADPTRPALWLTVPLGSIISLAPNRKTLDLSLNNLDPIEHKYRLFVKGEDQHGNSAEASFYFAYNLQLPKYNLEFFTDPAIPQTQKIGLSMPAPLGSGSAEEIALSKTGLLGYFDYSSATSYGFICTNAPGYNETDDSQRFNIPFLDITNNTSGDFLREAGITFYKITHTGYGGGDPRSCYEFTSLSTQEQAACLARFSSYSAISLHLIAFYMKDLRSSVGYNSRLELSTTASTTDDLYVLNNAENGLSELHTAAFTALDDDWQVATINSNKPSMLYYYDWFPGYSLPNTLQNLPTTRPLALAAIDNTKIRVALGNSKVSSFGIGDIDFENVNTYFALVARNNENKIFYKQDLLAKETQEIAIPALEEKPTAADGGYKILVSLASKSLIGGVADISKAYFDDIAIDYTSLGESGVSQFKAVDPNGVAPDYIENYSLSPTDGGEFGSKVSEVNVGAVYPAPYGGTGSKELKFVLKKDKAIYGISSEIPVYVKVWLEGDDYEDQYRWFKMDWDDLNQEYYKIYNPWFANNSTYLTNRLIGTGSSLPPAIPLEYGQNIVKYQFFTASHQKTAEEALVITASAPPDLQLLYAPVSPGSNLIAPQTLITIASDSPARKPDYDFYVLSFVGSSLQFNAAMSDELNNSDSLLIEENMTVYIGAVNKQGDYVELPHYFTNLDPDVFTATLLPSATSYDNLCYEAVIDVKDKNKFASTDVCFALTESPVTDGDTQWFTTPVTSQAYQVPQTGGVFEVQKAEITTDPNLLEKNYILKACLPYREDKAEGEVLTYYLWAKASGGAYLAIPNYETKLVGPIKITACNLKPKILSGEFVNGSFILTFSAPVKVTSPQYMGVEDYLEVHKNLPIFDNGEYIINYLDLYGNAYSEIINPISLEDRYKCAVTISPDELTNKDVYVTLDLSFNNEAWLDIDKDKLLTDGIIAGFDKIKEDAGGKLTSIEIQMSQNGDIPFKITPSDTAYPAANRMIPITNINKSLPSVTVAFTYDAAVIDGKTKGNITASLASDRAIVGYNGSSLIHVFTLENQTEERYFEYLDLFGNLSYVVATCPAQIVEQDIYDLDTDPPDYDLKIIRLENLVPKTMVNYTKAEYEARLAADTLEFPYFNNQLRLEFTVYDLNKTEMTLSAPGGGAALLGNTVTVYANSEFTVYITDAKGNVTTVPVKITGYDYDPPEGIVELIDMADFIRGYLAITNKVGQKISVTNKTGVGYDSLRGQYYHDFYKNETFIFLLLDEAGNTGAVSGRVGSLDTDPATVSISWMPYYVDGFGNINLDRLNTDPTNGNVTAYLKFSKPVKDIDLNLSGANPGDVSMTCTDLAATITFTNNASVKVDFTAVNNNITASRTISVTNIDKSQPQITATFLRVENKQAVFRFDADKNVFLLENEGVRDSGLKKWEKQHTLTFDLNGTYQVGFVDTAGNTIYVSVVVDQLDIMPPIFKIEDLPLTKAEVTKALASTDPDVITMIATYEAGGHKFEHLITKNNITLKVSINKAGVIRFNGQNYNVVKDAFIDLTVSQNGNYEIIATDLAGNQNAYLFTVDVIDKIAPSISFSGNLWVKQGSSRDEFLAAAKANVTVTDNLDPDMSGKWSVSELSGTELDTMGTYYITYTATDTAGNTATAERIVTVFDKDILEVKINGISTVPGDTLILSSKNITVTVANMLSGPGGNEPYKIKYQAGLNTNAQMKNAQDITAGGSFTAAKSGFYTIYVVTQSKKEYLTYIYLEF